MVRKLAMLMFAALVVAVLAPPATVAEARHTASGEVVAVDAETHQLKIRNGDQSLVFEVSSSTTITRNGEPIELGAVRAGDMATVNYEKGEGTPLALSIELKTA